MIFVTVACLPFIGATKIIGMDVFLDSFENPEYYMCVQDNDNLLELDANKGSHIIIQKTSHPGFFIENCDTVIYSNNTGALACNQISQISNIGAIKRYSTTDDTDISSKYIFDCQIIGKVIKVIDDSAWNTISIKIWEASIQNLNLKALLTDN